MTSRTLALGAVLLAPALLLTSCGGDDRSGDSKPSGPDRSSFVPITAEGIAAVVDEHLGDRVSAYAVFADEPRGDLAERSIQVTLRDAAKDDTFLVSVYPEGGSQGQVIKGECTEAGSQDDPQTEVTCAPGPDGGNVTITRFPFSLTSADRTGSYLMASGTGPEEREVTASYDTASKRPPIADEELNALLADPYLGWETDPKYNEAGASLEVSPADE
jgi:hypothetical protein